jgi:hypothetical protein
MLRKWQRNGRRFAPSDFRRPEGLRFQRDPLSRRGQERGSRVEGEATREPLLAGHSILCPCDCNAQKDAGATAQQRTPPV